jgi:hypothetical protein
VSRTGWRAPPGRPAHVAVSATSATSPESSAAISPSDAEHTGRLRLRPNLRDLLRCPRLWPLLLFLWIGRIHVCRVGYLNPRNLPMVQFGMPTSPLLVNHLVLLKPLKILDGRLQWMRNMMP